MSEHGLSAAFREAFTLSREAQDAGLVVTCMAPHRCAHSSGSDDYEFQVGLYQPDGLLWAEGTHESAELIREQHIGGWRRYRAERPPPATVPIGLDKRMAVLRVHRPELAAVLGVVDTMLGGDPYQEGRHAMDILEHLERLGSLSPDGDSVIIDVTGTVATLTQTTDRDLRVAVNGAWVVAPVRERVQVDFQVPVPPAQPVQAHLVLPHHTRQMRRDPRPGEVLAYLNPGDVARVLRLPDTVRIADAWVEDDPPRLLLRLRGDVDLVRAAFPGATEFAGPREAL